MQSLLVSIISLLMKNKENKEITGLWTRFGAITSQAKQLSEITSPNSFSREDKINRYLNSISFKAKDINALSFANKLGIAALHNRKALTDLYNDITKHSPKIKDTFSISPFVNACKGAVVTKLFDRGDELISEEPSSQLVPEESSSQNNNSTYALVPPESNVPTASTSGTLPQSPLYPNYYGNQPIDTQPFSSPPGKGSKLRRLFNWKA